MIKKLVKCLLAVYGVVSAGFGIGFMLHNREDGRPDQIGPKSVDDAVAFWFGAFLGVPALVMIAIREELRTRKQHRRAQKLIRETDQAIREYRLQDQQASQS